MDFQKCIVTFLTLFALYIVTTCSELSLRQKNTLKATQEEAVPQSIATKTSRAPHVKGLKEFTSTLSQRQDTDWKSLELEMNDNHRSLAKAQDSHTNIHRYTTTAQHSPVNKGMTHLPSSYDNQNLYYEENSKQPEAKPFNTRKGVDKTILHFSFWSTADNPLTEYTSPSLCRITHNGTYANCSFMHLTSVPCNGIPVNIFYLDLHNNNITRLFNYTFKNYTQLTYLDLSQNQISVLEELAFSGLEQLKTLNLSDNLLAMNDYTYPEYIFSSLVRLEELKINKNNRYCVNSTGMNYADKALSRLTNLRWLYMDGLYDTDFGPGFQNLTRLVNLSLTGYKFGCCHINSLRNETFQYSSGLQDLDISNCYILGNRIQPGAFSSLRNLVSLDLTHNEDIDIENLDNVFYGLREITSLKKLSMNLIVNRYSIGICLDKFFIRNYPKQVEHLAAQENNIEGLDREVLGLFGSLKTLDVSGNRFVFGTYLQDLPKMKSLTRLKVNGGGFTYSFPNLYPYQAKHHGASKNCTLYGAGGVGVQNYTHFSLLLPPNLEHVEMNDAELKYTLSNLTIDPNNVLRNLTMQGNKFPDLIGPFEGLHSLEYLDLSSNYVKNISDKFFIYLTTLKTLKLDTNLLGEFFSSQTSHQVFFPLSNLTLLDLSFNDIQSFSKSVFSGLNSLQTLLLQRNFISEFDVTISHMNSLSLVNFSTNRMPKLLPDVKKHIDFLLHKGLNVTIDMSECPISCNCDNLNFISWMKQSGAFNNGSPIYLCIYSDDSSKRILDGYNATIEILLRECSSNMLLFFIVAGTMLLVFCVIICSVLYRFRWKIRYLYYAAYLFYKSTKRDKHSKNFEYDAFISYDQEDENFVVRKMSRELERRGLKLCIHGRDFRAGEYIASNIVRAVCCSRRTVVVLTRHLISSYWCKYEIQMANMESVYTGRDVLLFLLMEKIPESDLGVELLYHIRNNTYIPYPDPLPDATSIGRLWDKLAADIRN